MKNWLFEPPKELPKEGRTCSRCGWYYPPSSYALKECKWCDTPLEVQICKYCGRPISIDEAYRLDTNYIARVCSLCEKLLGSFVRKKVKGQQFLSRINRVRRMNEEYAKFVATYKLKVMDQKISVADTNKIADRRHIGCALCHGEIDIHIMLIPPRLGGLYEPCNILPLCEDHAEVLEYDYNPLVATDNFLNEDSTQKIYLEMVKILTKKENWLDNQEY